MKISIIVPVYNKEKYLPQCIDSLVNQTYEDIEILLVENNSTDSAPQICQEYATKYPSKIRYFSQKGLGSAGARNLGIRESTGDYLTFVDCDDYLDYEACEILLKWALVSGADITKGDVARFNQSITSQEFNAESLTALKSGFYIEPNAKMATSLFSIQAKLYKKSYIDLYQVRFADNCIIDDSTVSMRDFSLPSSIYQLALKDKKGLYYWRENETSYTRQFEKFYDKFVLTFQYLITQFIKDKKKYLLETEILEFKQYLYNVLRGGFNAFIGKSTLDKKAKKMMLKYAKKIIGTFAKEYGIKISKKTRPQRQFKIYPLQFVKFLLTQTLPYFLLKRINLK